MSEEDATARALHLMNLTAEVMWQKLRALKTENARLLELVAAYEAADARAECLRLSDENAWLREAANERYDMIEFHLYGGSLPEDLGPSFSPSLRFFYLRSTGG